MGAGHILLVGVLAIAPAPSRTSPGPAIVPTSAVVEGPAPPPSVDERWLRRDLRLRAATLTTTAVVGVSAASLGVVGGVMASRDQSPGDGSAEAKGLAAAGIIFGAAFLAFAVSGVLWQDHRYKRPPSLEPSQRVWEPNDPRSNPAWVKRDQRLTRAINGAGAALGVALAGFGVSLALLLRPNEGTDPRFTDHRFTEGSITISMAVLSAMLLIPVASIAHVRHTHRNPPPTVKFSPTDSGLGLKF